MPVHFFASAVSSAVPTEYWASLAASFVAISFLKTWSKGAKLLDPPPPRPSKDASAPPSPPPEAQFNDLHGRVVLVASGAFTPLGAVTLSALAHRGAQIIALTHDISSPEVIQLVHLIRDSAQSELIYAEQCDIASLESVSAFAALWNAGDKKEREGVRRLDAMLFLPPGRDELQRVETQSRGRAEKIYQLHVLSRFHLVNSLLSSLLILPPDREIRIVSVISPFYAAGLNHFDILPGEPSAPSQPSKKKSSKAPAQLTAKSLAESSYSALIGAASLRWYALTTELQRRVDLLAEADPRSRTKLPGIDVQNLTTHTASNTKSSTGTTSTQDLAAQRMRQHSNISIINVCPGFERDSDIINTFFPSPSVSRKSTLLVVRYYLLYVLRFALLVVVWPIVWLLSKSPATAANSVVWATTRKLEPLSARYTRILASLSPTSATTSGGVTKAAAEDAEVRRWRDGLIPGEMYREGRIIRPLLPERFYKAPKKTSDQKLENQGEAWAELWKQEEEEVERRVEATGGSIKRPKLS